MFFVVQVVLTLQATLILDNGKYRSEAAKQSFLY